MKTTTKHIIIYSVAGIVLIGIVALATYLLIGKSFQKQNTNMNNNAVQETPVDTKESNIEKARTLEAEAEKEVNNNNTATAIKKLKEAEELYEKAEDIDKASQANLRASQLKNTPKQVAPPKLPGSL